MPATTRSARCSKTVLPTPRRFLRCLACQTVKKERSYALCSECYKHNGTLDRERFAYLARRAERESVQYSYRSHPDFENACRIYASAGLGLGRQPSTTPVRPNALCGRRTGVTATSTSPTTGSAVTT